MGYDKGGRRVFHTPNRFAKRRVGGIIQRGSAVIQNQNFRGTNKRPCDGKPLPLSSREVHPSLLHRGTQLPVLILHDLPCLGNLQCSPQIIVRGVLIAPKEVLTDGSFKQYRFLRNNSDLMPEGIHVVFIHILSANQHLPFRGIVQSGNETDQRCLAGSCSSDNADGLTGLCQKRYIHKRGISRITVPGAYTPEFHFTGDSVS